MKKRNSVLFNQAQKLYIAWASFVSNDLTSYAAAGAYGFLLSALPVLLLVMGVLIRVLNTSTSAVQEFVYSIGFISSAIDIERIINSVASAKSLGILEIIVGVSVFWMARRFFVSMQQGLHAIYRKRRQKKPIKENLLVIAGEAIFIIIIALFVIVSTAGNALAKTLIPEFFLTPLMASLMQRLFRFAPYTVIIIFLWIVYWIAPGKHREAPLHSCIASVACTVIFMLIQLIFSSFINMSRYNLIYGILSNVIVLVLEVYIFFILFLFFAQFQYVSLFFDSHLLTRLYLLPPYNAANLLSQCERTLFLHPVRLYRRYAYSLEKGSVIFEIGERSSDVYYIWSGAVKLVTAHHISELDRGCMFGEFACLIGGVRTATAICMSRCILLRIPDSLFRETIEISPEMSRRTLQMVAEYVKKSTSEW